MGRFNRFGAATNRTGELKFTLMENIQTEAQGKRNRTDVSIGDRREL